MSYRLICFLLFYLIFGGIAGFTLYMFFTKFGGFGSIPTKVPDKLPNTPTKVPSVPTQTPNTPSLDDIKNNKWVYGGVGIGSVIIFSLMTVCGFFWCLCHSSNNRQNIRANNESYELRPINRQQVLESQAIGSNSENDEQKKENIRQLLNNLNNIQKNRLSILLASQEEINCGRNNNLVQEQYQRARNIVGITLSNEEIILLEENPRLVNLELRKFEAEHS